ncbi:AraC family transcriptional regulator [Paenibacillus sp. GYB003]|uniref:AraC family transcriptional regulator n=1 Tax=Paenibacillus sp. GYB003 TaxID=2994392 RepID=UPI002F967C4C
MTFYPASKQLNAYAALNKRCPLILTVNEVKRHFPAHRHDFLECSLVIGGEGYELINGDKHPMKPGTFTFLLPYHVHEIFTVSEQPLRLYNCMFDPNVLFRSSETGAGLKDLLFAKPGLPPSVHLSDEHFGKLAGILDEMMREYDGDDAWRNDMLRLKLAEVLIRFDRIRRAKKTARSADDSAGGGSVWPIVRHIYLHYREPMSLSELAELFGMSPSHLSEEIKKHLGITFVRFLHEIRIHHACSLLASTNIREYDIALEVGFGSYKTFSRLFRELKGVTPSDYRRNRLAGSGR